MLLGLGVMGLGVFGFLLGVLGFFKDFLGVLVFWFLFGVLANISNFCTSRLTVVGSLVIGLVFGVGIGSSLVIVSWAVGWDVLLGVFGFFGVVLG